jgi:hypothetical protein
MTEPHADTSELNLRIAVAKDRLSRLLEGTPNEGNPGQLPDLMREEESEIEHLTVSRDEAAFSPASSRRDQIGAMGEPRDGEGPAVAVRDMDEN